MKSKIRQTYQRTVEYCSSRNIGILVSVLFMISLFPIIRVGLHNYATGDDYWFSLYTYRAWVETGSILEALKGSVQMVIRMYEEWQGTWFTLFLFTLSPNNFWENGYVLTVFMSLGLLIGGISCLAGFYLVKKLNFTKGATAIIICLVSWLSIQYIPRTTSGIYWYNGVAHYSVPFFLGCLAIIQAHLFVETKRKRNLIITFLVFTLLGGGSYLVPLSATLAVVLILLAQLKAKEGEGKRECSRRGEKKKIRLSFDRRNLWLLLPLLAEFAGLLISFKAPGNSVRGGEEFGADLGWAVKTVYYAIDRGIYLGIDFFRENPVTVVVYLMLALLIWSQLWRVNREKVRFRLPLLFVLYMNGIYWASYTPEIYARSDVSGGVQNTYFHIFLLVTLANIIYVQGWIQEGLRKMWKKKNGRWTYVNGEIKSSLYGVRYREYILIPGIVVGVLLLIFLNKSNLLTSTNDYCIALIRSGKLWQYEEIRQEQHRILTESEEEEVVVPEMEAKYPLLNMTLSENPKESRNIDRALYYGKKSVTAVRVE